jgi:hypothetical protein
MDLTVPLINYRNTYFSIGSRNIKFYGCSWNSTTAAGVATFISPVFATWPATKLAAPCTSVMNDELTHCLRERRVVEHQPAFAERLKVVPSLSTSPSE